MLNYYGPSLIVQCENFIDMSKELVKNWLENWMFKDDPKSNKKAEEISTYFADYNNFKTQNRHISRESAKSKGLVIDNLEEDYNLQDLVLSVFHAATHTFSSTPAVKIIENHLGKAFIKIQLPKQ